ncbi:hypothetical protein L1887_15239 [Cichorium endivia]|nr:hypothetical protein L1887_15239 [Cichorium endivia]
MQDASISIVGKVEEELTNILVNTGRVKSQSQQVFSFTSSPSSSSWQSPAPFEYSVSVLHKNIKPWCSITSKRSQGYQPGKILST